MLNRYVVGMLMAGLAITLVRAEITPNDLKPGQVSRYDQVEVMDYWGQDLASHAPELSSDLSNLQSPYYDDLSTESTDVVMTSELDNLPLEEKSADCKQLVSLNDVCIVNNQVTRTALNSQIQYLRKYPSYQRFAKSGVNLSGNQLLNTANEVLKWLNSQEALTDRFELVNLSHYTDSKVKFTGYYTPEISARRTYTPEYYYPIYRQPTDFRRVLSRADINNGALENGGYEIAWVKNPIDLFYIHMQGSGVLTFADGEKKVLHYVGSNGRPFKSIAKYMQSRGYLNGDLSRRAIEKWFEEHPQTMGEVFAQNPRYVYFNLRDSMASTASGMNLVPGYTVAVDTRFIPFGAVLLAEVPRINEQGAVMGYEWRLLFPQDRGNAIKGSSRLDFYTGTGELARKWANKVTGFRHAYLLLDKGQQAIQMVSINQTYD